MGRECANVHRGPRNNKGFSKQQTGSMTAIGPHQAMFATALLAEHRRIVHAKNGTSRDGLPPTLETGGDATPCHPIY